MFGMRTKTVWRGGRVRRAARRANRRAFYQYGGFVRTTARRSIRKRKSPSEPGEPPHGHGRNPLKHGIQYAVSDDNVVIGPIQNRPGDILRTLEYGGYVPAHKNPRRRRREIGGGGELVVGGPATGTTRTVRDWQGKLRRVTYGKLFSQAQARRANRLNAELFGPQRFPGRYQAPRPFMRPAQAKANERLLPDIWRDSMRA